MSKGTPFSSIIDVAKHSSCRTCEKFIYTMPCNIDVDFEEYMFSVGGLSWPLKKIKMVKIDNEYLKVTSRVGRNWLEVKFKHGKEEIMPVWNVAIAAYVEAKQGIKIVMD